MQIDGDPEWVDYRNQVSSICLVWLAKLRIFFEFYGGCLALTSQLNLAESCLSVWKPMDAVNHVPRLWEGYREQRRQLQECKYGLPNVPES